MCWVVRLLSYNSLRCISVSQWIWMCSHVHTQDLSLAVPWNHSSHRSMPAVCIWGKSLHCSGIPPAVASGIQNEKTRGKFWLSHQLSTWLWIRYWPTARLYFFISEMGTLSHWEDQVDNILGHWPLGTAVLFVASCPELPYSFSAKEQGPGFPCFINPQLSMDHVQVTVGSSNNSLPVGLHFHKVNGRCTATHFTLHKNAESSWVKGRVLRFDLRRQIACLSSLFCVREAWPAYQNKYGLFH